MISPWKLVAISVVFNVVYKIVKTPFVMYGKARYPVVDVPDLVAPAKLSENFPVSADTDRLAASRRLLEGVVEGPGDVRPICNQVVSLAVMAPSCAPSICLFICRSLPHRGTVGNHETAMSDAALADECAESIIFDSDGKMYTMEKGGIYQSDPDGSNRSLYVYTGGRPLGAKFDSHGNLYFADLAKARLRNSCSNHSSLLRANPLSVCHHHIVRLCSEDGALRFGARRASPWLRPRPVE